MSQAPAVKDFKALAPIVHAAMTARQEEEHSAELKAAQNVRGFVKAIPASKTAHNKMPTLVGLFVPGNHGARVFYADHRAPEWFIKALEEESLKSNPLQFRVRVGAISKNGNSAFVWPIAKDLAHAKKEWQNEQRQMDKTPKSIDQCKTKVDVARFVYAEYARGHGGVIVNFQQQTDGKGQPIEGKYSAYMVKAPFFQKTIRLTGGDDVWLYTDGIAQGNTTLEQEIERNVKFSQL